MDEIKDKISNSTGLQAGLDTMAMVSLIGATIGFLLMMIANYLCSGWDCLAAYAFSFIFTVIAASSLILGLARRGTNKVVMTSRNKKLFGIAAILIVLFIGFLAFKILSAG